jgi:DNA-binding response OmpR family regulator
MEKNLVLLSTQLQGGIDRDWNKMKQDKRIANWTGLIVDNEAYYLKLVEKYFTANGAEVYLAENGKEGLALLEVIKPTFVLLDLSMPEMTGWEMLKAIRSNGATANIPVIAVTALASQEDRRRVLEAGFDSYIIKPFHLDLMVTTIKNCLDRSKGVDQQQPVFSS